MKIRTYNKYNQKAIAAINTAINSFNQVYGAYNTEATLLLLANAWELLAKAILIKNKQSIYIDKNKTQSISLEKALFRLKDLKIIDHSQSQVLLQIASLRNEACHSILPPIPQEIQHHLFFFACKFFKDIYKQQFKKTHPLLNKNFLSLSFDQLKTYADCVQKLVSKIKRASSDDKKIVWLLERGVAFEGKNFISQSEFEKIYQNKRKPMSHLKLNKFIKDTDMLRIVAVQAPKNFTADITLRKGKNHANESLPVIYKSSNPEETHPYLTSNIAEKVNKSQQFISQLIKYLDLKKDEKYHLQVTSSKSSAIHKYSGEALQKIQTFLMDNPDFNPWKGNSKK